MPIQENSGTSVTIDGIKYLYFGGTNYLGLAQRRELLEAALSAFNRFGFSAGASRLTSGESAILLELEQEMAAFSKSEAAMILPSGYISNFAMVDAIEDKVDAWIIQENAHKSITAAISQSRKPTFSLEIPANSKISSIPHLSLCPKNFRKAYILEPIEPMTGKLTDPTSVVQNLGAHDFLILDESHSMGVLGAKGKGAMERFNLSNKQNFVRTGTFSKAFGTQGGFVLGSRALVSQIIERSPSYRSSTPLSPVLVAATLESLRLLTENPESTIKKLTNNVKFMRNRLASLNISGAEDVPIFHLSGLSNLSLIQAAIKDMRMFVPQVGSYFAGAENIGLRWTVQANHTDAELTLLSDTILATL